MYTIKFAPFQFTQLLCCMVKEKGSANTYGFNSIIAQIFLGFFSTQEAESQASKKL